MPFSDPMADGPAIQAAGLRALQGRHQAAGDPGRRSPASGKADSETPIVLMGYYNPLFRYGVDRFCTDAVAAGVDGMIIVDLPPEESDELMPQARAAGLDFIRLTAPTSDDVRLPRVLRLGQRFHLPRRHRRRDRHALGRTRRCRNRRSSRLKRHTDLPVAVGFGIKHAGRRPPRLPASPMPPSSARRWSTISPRHLDADGRALPGLVDAVVAQVRMPLPPASAPRARSEKRETCHELAHQRRPAQDPRRRFDQARGAGQSLDQMPRLRPDAVPSRAGSESERLPRLRSSHAHRCQEAHGACLFDKGQYTRIELPKRRWPIR